MTKIKGVFLRQKTYGIDWPGARYDINSHIEDYTRQLSRMGKELDIDVELTNPVYDQKGVEKLVTEEREAATDGLVIVVLGLETWNLANDIVENAKKPAVIYTPFCGFTKSFSELSRKKGVYFLSTLDFNSVRNGMKMIDSIHKLAQSRVLVLKGNKPEPIDSTVENLGTKVRTVAAERFIQEYRNISETEEVKEIARQYIEGAERVVEPTEQDVIKAAKTYVAARNLIRKYEADAITIDCLGLINSNLLDTTPCIALSKLSDEGVAAGCEADLDSTLTMLISHYLLGEPSFIGDPTVDTVRNTWINSHCTSPTKLSGPDGNSAPYNLRGYAHLDLGVSPQVFWPEGQEVTLAKYQRHKEMVIGSGKVIRNIDTPPSRMCITSVEVDVDGVNDMRDVERDVKDLHVLLIYGNHTKELETFCQLRGLEAINITGV